MPDTESGDDAAEDQTDTPDNRIDDPGDVAQSAKTATGNNDGKSNLPELGAKSSTTISERNISPIEVTISGPMSEAKS
jgi:hypothetical protein